MKKLITTILLGVFFSGCTTERTPTGIIIVKDYSSTQVNAVYTSSDHYYRDELTSKYETKLTGYSCSFVAPAHLYEVGDTIKFCK